MWISKRKYDRIIARLDELETQTDVPYSTIHVGVLVGLLMDHLKVRPEKTMPVTRLVQKGGPERGE
jgi:hypothetical protein